MLSILFVPNAFCASQEDCDKGRDYLACYETPGCWVTPNQQCEVCPPGLYCPGNSTPQPCPEGKTTSGEGSESENDCNVQISCDKEEGDCIATKGCYIDTNGKCAVCPAGSYCPAGSRDEITCPQGYYCPQGASKMKCPKGTTTESTGADSLNDCGVFCSIYNDATGFEQTYCENAVGCYIGADGKCANCPAGYYCPAASGDRIKCPLNSTSKEGAYKKSDCYIGEDNTICDSSNKCYSPDTKYYYRPTDAELLEEKFKQLTWPLFEKCMEDFPMPSC